MKITVMGATGQIGSQVVELLRADGHEVVASSRSSGADVLTGAGLADALAGTDVLIDVTNSPSFEDDPVMDFFSRSSANLVSASRAAGVGHYVVLSIVGVDGLPESGYMRAKAVQEKAVSESGLPYTIVRATQFHEFAEMITGSLTVGDEVHAPDAAIQPIAAADVAAEVARAAVGTPRGGVVDIGGPQKMSFADLARAVLAASGDERSVVVDPTATYFGTPVGEHSLVTGDGAVIAKTTFDEWLATR
ncbi:NAD(P)H-binding protein [Mycolicibacterium sp. S2-37]|uniref:SDR family oxidoreductase n=1 Tax=Mycolicibacterium sp. S2-37 TaxID=2810297 RepID=UPI001A94A76D|nr:NAD(P)H-binding protein [Mycolicibacterium sp. S2-37]MBO0677320.1 NAD(P)H-binding protein [Mycolicibacterium sp. S2-37]